MIVFRISTLREVDGRWIGCVPELPGVLAYGDSENLAACRAQAVALRIIADGLEFQVPVGEAPLDRPIVAVRFVRE